jgi:integrase
MAPKKKPVKQPRRKPGTGAIRHRRGRALPFEASFKHSDGSTQYDAFLTAEEAAAHLDGLIAARDDAKAPRNIAKGSQTVTQFLTAWLQIKSARVAEKTFLDYKYQCELAIDKIGRERLASVDLLMCDTMLAAFAREGYKNVSQMRMVLRQAFQYAFDNDYIHKNPFQKAVAPRTKHRKAIALTEQQRAILLETARIEDGMPLEPLWHLESRLAFRRGEALGLRWSDIDFKNATITIRQQRTTVGNATVTKDAPKGDTDGSKIRTVPVYPDILELLSQHRADQMKRAAGDPDWVMAGLVFVGDHGRAPAANRVNRRLAKIIERVNSAGPILLPRELTPHSLRHTALFLLEQAGIPTSIRMALGGHSTASMALHYIDHASVEDVRRAIGG